MSGRFVNPLLPCYVDRGARGRSFSTKAVVIQSGVVNEPKWKVIYIGLLWFEPFPLDVSWFGNVSTVASGVIQGCVWAETAAQAEGEGRGSPNVDLITQPAC